MPLLLQLHDEELHRRMAGPGIDRGWVEVGRLNPGDEPGSIGSNATGNREVIRFRWEEGVAIIDRSQAGADIEEGAYRRIISTGFEELARLRHPGDQYEMDVLTDRMTKVHKLRFIYADH